MSRKWFRKEAEPLVQDYLDQFPRWGSKSGSAMGSSFTILDIETTGFDAWSDKIVSIAWMKAVDGELLVESARSEIIFQPNVDLKDSSEIHGILSDQVKEGRELKDVLAELLVDLSDSVIVGHHIGFDIRMLNQSLQKHYGIRLRNRSLDTAAMAMKVFDAFKRTGYANQRPPTLDEVCTHCELEVAGRHTAEGDVLATAQLFLLMLARLRKRQKRPLQLKQLPLRRASHH